MCTEAIHNSIFRTYKAYMRDAIVKTNEEISIIDKHRQQYQELTQICTMLQSRMFASFRRPFSISTGLASPKNPNVRCTIFSNTGDIVAHGKEEKRSEFMNEFHLAPRDLRKFSRAHSRMVPSFHTRSHIVLFNILDVRALVQHNRVVLFDLVGSRSFELYSHSQLTKSLVHNLREENLPGMPYEFRAFEAIYEHVVSNLRTEMKVHTTVTQNILRGLEDHIDTVKLRYLLTQSKKVTQFQQKATLIRDHLDDILQRDDYLNALYMLDFAAGRPHTGTDHEEVEMLFESYYNSCDEVVQTVAHLRSQIRTTEEIINVVLDSNRNELMMLRHKFSVGLLSMGIVLYVAAVYGMNLENFIEEYAGGFEFAVVLSFVMLAIVASISLHLLKKVQKVTMMGLTREDVRIARNKIK